MAKRTAKLRESQAQVLAGYYNVASVITIDGRGQMVLPKQTREKAGIKAGDKLAVVTWGRNGEVCCISLIKAERLADMVKELLGSLSAFGAERCLNHGRRTS